MYNSKFELGFVALNVSNLEKQRLYYQNALGMQLIFQNDKIVDLGVDEKILVRLIKTDLDEKITDSYGLYHLAIVLPSREDLGQILKHFIDNKIALLGASNHGYSEAIYLKDTEGNGIEIYRDCDIDDWDIREDGRIIGITEAMDFEAVYALGKVTNNPYSMPVGSRMGHIHLSVRDSRVSSNFYQDILGVKEKFALPSAAWLASGDYHHHLACNEWGGKKLKIRVENLPGLAYYTIIYRDVKEYENVIEAIKIKGFDVDINEKESAFIDMNGIKTKLILLE